MNRFRGIFISILFLLIVEKLIFVNGNAGYQWVSIKPGESWPKNTVLVDSSFSSGKYIGRARHFDEILPAEVYENGTAVIFSCNKFFVKEQYEVLTTSTKCKWISFSNLNEIEETVVRVGTAWNGEPTYLGGSRGDYYSTRILAKIYLTSESFHPMTTNTYYRKNNGYLSCTSTTQWIDTAAAKLPNNTVTGGKSEEGYDIYVAKLKRGCNIVGGQAIPEIGTATAFLNNGTSIESTYCQVLIDESNKYTWMTVSDGEIPDYAVAAGKNKNEVEYVARFNKTLGYITHSEALREELEYEILVANPLVV